KAGKLLMLPAASWYGEYIFGGKPDSLYYQEADGRLGVAAPLKWADEDTAWTGAQGGSSWAVSKHTENPQLAADFVIFVTTADGYQGSAPTYPAYKPAAKVWSQTLASNKVYAFDPFPVLEASAGLIDPLWGNVRYDRASAFSTVVIAALKDGHSSISFLQNQYPFQHYPLYFYPFSEGVYLIQAAPEYADLIGSRLVRVGETEINQVIERLMQLAPRDNDSSGLVTVPMMLSMADVLLGTGLIGDSDQPAYLLERPGGEQVTLNLAPVSFAAYSEDISTPWRLPNREMPLSLSRVDEAFWWTYLDDERVIYLQYNQVATRSVVSGLTISSLRRELESAMAAHSVERFILDLRYNGGGDVGTAGSLRSFFAGNDFFQEPGNLLVLTGRNTFSAAVVFSLWLEHDVDPVFMGEPTGGKPLMFENARTFHLPNSQLDTQIATRARHDVVASDSRQAVEPQRLISPPSVGFFAGTDPLLEAALAYPDAP
ncbi:MAG: hypothetical protein ABI835_09785, partial [Chloroflexota bacterium]